MAATRKSQHAQQGLRCGLHGRAVRTWLHCLRYEALGLLRNLERLHVFQKRLVTQWLLPLGTGSHFCRLLDCLWDLCRWCGKPLQRLLGQIRSPQHKGAKAIRRRYRRCDARSRLWGKAATRSACVQKLRSSSPQRLHLGRTTRSRLRRGCRTICDSRRAAAGLGCRAEATGDRLRHLSLEGLHHHQVHEDL